MGSKIILMVSFCNFVVIDVKIIPIKFLKTFFYFFEIGFPLVSEANAHAYQGAFPMGNRYNVPNVQGSLSRQDVAHRSMKLLFFKEREY